MTTDAATAIVLRALHEVAPEAEITDIEPDADLRDQFDIDSMDFLNFVIGIHEATGIDVPEADYQQLETLQSSVSYVVQHSD